MVRKGRIETEGVVEQVLGGGFFRVKLDNGAVLQAKLSGRLREHSIKVVPDDRVRVEVSAADLTKGSITFRL